MPIWDFSHKRLDMTKQKSSSDFGDSCHYLWGYVDESDIAKDDECGNILGMVVIVVVGYILSMYLKCCMCKVHLLSMSHPHHMCLGTYVLPLFTVEFLRFC